MALERPSRRAIQSPRPDEADWSQTRRPTAAIRSQGRWWRVSKHRPSPRRQTATRYRLWPDPIRPSIGQPAWPQSTPQDHCEAIAAQHERTQPENNQMVRVCRQRKSADHRGQNQRAMRVADITTASASGGKPSIQARPTVDMSGGQAAVMISHRYLRWRLNQPGHAEDDQRTNDQKPDRAMSRHAIGEGCQRSLSN